MTVFLCAAAAILVITFIGWIGTAILIARRVVGPGRPHWVPVLDDRGDSIILANIDSAGTPGLRGLWAQDGGHILVDAVREKEAVSGTVERVVVARTASTMPAGSSVRVTGHVFAGPEQFPGRVEHVLIATAVGDAPAWLITPENPSDTWAIHIHGIRTTRVTALRSVPAANASGMPSLVVSFRGDGEAPSAGASTLGGTEWSDVDAALEWAITRGARRFVLFGWSMGATVALLLAERSAHRRFIAHLVLIAPATDWVAVINHAARQKHLPRPLARTAIGILANRVLAPIAGLSAPIEFSSLNWSGQNRVNIPTLVVHSPGDEEIPFSLTQRFSAANKGVVAVAEFPATGHALEYNVDPEGFNRIVAETLGSEGEA